MSQEHSYRLTRGEGEVVNLTVRCDDTDCVITGAHLVNVGPRSPQMIGLDPQDVLPRLERAGWCLESHVVVAAP